jgi:hypothetical protein
MGSDIRQHKSCKSVRCRVGSPEVEAGHICGATTDICARTAGLLWGVERRGALGAPAGHRLAAIARDVGTSPIPDEARAWHVRPPASDRRSCKLIGYEMTEAEQSFPSPPASAGPAGLQRDAVGGRRGELAALPITTSRSRYSTLAMMPSASNRRIGLGGHPHAPSCRTACPRHLPGEARTDDCARAASRSKVRLTAWHVYRPSWRRGAHLTATGHMPFIEQACPGRGSPRADAAGQRSSR